MSPIWRIGTPKTLSFAVGVTLGPVSAAPARSGARAQLPAQPPDPQEAFCQRPIVAGCRQQPSAEEPVGGEMSAAPSQACDGSATKLAKCMRQLYEQIVRQADTAIRP